MFQFYSDIITHSQGGITDIVYFKTGPQPGGATHHPKSAKRSTFCHKVGQKWHFCRRVIGVRFKKSTIWVQKVHFLGVPHLLRIDPGYGPALKQASFTRKILKNKVTLYSLYFSAWFKGVLHLVLQVSMFCALSQNNQHLEK